jgi:putative nucleotidyltransferase with HDIG domain
MGTCPIQPETAAHERRVAALSSRMKDARARELCAAFDEAVEFSACEGISIAEAMAGFFREEADPGQAELLSVLEDGAGRRSPGEYKLPAMPAAVTRLLRTSELTTSAAELEQIAGSDQVLAAKLLGAANSARFGSRFEILRVGEAVLRLGVPAARQVLLASGIGLLFASKPLHDLWEHSRQVADTAGEMARLAGVEPEAAWLAGLLHDIGRLGLSTRSAESRIAEQSWIEAGFPLVYAETLVYGIDHAALGANLLRAWGIPGSVVEAVRFHHRPECSDVRLIQVLFLAEDMCCGTDRRPHEDLWPGLRGTIAGQRAGVDPGALAEFATRHLKQPVYGRVCA